MRDCVTSYVLTALKHLLQIPNLIDAGAVGVLAYLEPSSSSTLANETYPNTPQRSADAVFARSFWNIMGDMRTPGFPSTDGMFRRSMNSSLSGLPTIPVQPISFKSAHELLKLLGG